MRRVETGWVGAAAKALLAGATAVGLVLDLGDILGSEDELPPEEWAALMQAVATQGQRVELIVRVGKAATDTTNATTDALKREAVRQARDRVLAYLSTAIEVDKMLGAVVAFEQFCAKQLGVTAPPVSPTVSAPPIVAPKSSSKTLLVVLAALACGGLLLAGRVR